MPLSSARARLRHMVRRFPENGHPWRAYAKGLHSTAQGGEAHPGNNIVYPRSTLKGLYNPFGLKAFLILLGPRVRCGTLGCGVQPLRGKNRTDLEAR